MQQVARTPDRARIGTMLVWLGIMTFWFLMLLGFAKNVSTGVLSGEFIGNDGYMRLVRVLELIHGEGWYDSTIARLDAPYGSVLHWTRPFDLILLALAGLARPFTASLDSALIFAGMAVSPLLTAISCMAMAWAVRPLLGHATGILAAILLLLQPGVVAYSLVGRADHHALQFLFTVLCLGLALRLLMRPDGRATGYLAGGAYAASVWVSVEMMLLAGLFIGAQSLRWINDPDGRPLALLRSTGAFAAAIAIALLVERPPAALLAVEFDRISIVHLAIVTVTFLCWLAIDATRGGARTGYLLHSVRGRFAACAVAGCLGAGFLVVAFPALIVGPFGQLDPRIVPIWHERVLELRPIVPSDLDGLRDFLFFLGGVTPALFLLVHIALREPANANRAAWLMLLLVAAVYYAMAVKHLRFAPFAEIAAVPALAELLRRFLDYCRMKLLGLAQRAVKISGGFILVLGSLFLGATLPADNAGLEAARPKICKVSDVAHVLNDPTGIGRTPRIIAAYMDYGSEILYRTPHAVIGAPYHRNGDGIWDGYRFLATTDAAESRAILERRKADYILACYSQKEVRFFTELSEPGNLFTRLEQGDLPSWLEPLPYDPKAVGGFHIYRIVK